MDVGLKTSGISRQLQSQWPRQNGAIRLNVSRSSLITASRSAKFDMVFCESNRGFI